MPDFKNRIPDPNLTLVIQAQNQAKAQPLKFRVPVQPNTRETEAEPMVNKVQKELVD